MKQWFRLWLGHVLLVVTGGLVLLAGWFFLEAARATAGDRMFWLFVCGLLTILLAVVFGALAAWKFRTHRERYYIRHEYDIIEPGYKPAGGHK